MNTKRWYYCSVGILFHIVLILSIGQLIKFYGLSYQQFVFRGIEKLGGQPLKYQSFFLNREQSQSVQPYVFLGQSNRILKSNPSYSLNKNDLKKVCRRASILDLATCFYLTGNKRQALIKQLTNFTVSLPNDLGSNGNVWQLAIAYDLIHKTLNLTSVERQKIEKILSLGAFQYEMLLNSDGPSLWQGRAVLASQLWLTVSAMTDAEYPLKQAATFYFKQIISAMDLVDVWPTGFADWVNHRGWFITLASTSFLNSTEFTPEHTLVIKYLNQLAKWQASGIRPDGTFTPLKGDNKRLDLAFRTAVIADVYQLNFPNEMMANVAKNISSQHGYNAYDAGYNWLKVLRAASQKTLKETLLNNVENGQVFFASPEYLGLSFVKGFGSSQATHLAINGNHGFTHNDNANSGTFSVFKNGAIVVNGSNPYPWLSDKSNTTLANYNGLVSRQNSKEKEGSNSRYLSLQQNIFSPNYRIKTISDWQQRRMNSLVNLLPVSSVYADVDVFYQNINLTNQFQSTVNNYQRKFLYDKEQELLLIIDEISVQRAQNSLAIQQYLTNAPLHTSTIALSPEHNFYSFTGKHYQGAILGDIQLVEMSKSPSFNRLSAQQPMKLLQYDQRMYNNWGKWRIAAQLKPDLTQYTVATIYSLNSKKNLNVEQVNIIKTDNSSYSLKVFNRTYAFGQKLAGDLKGALNGTSNYMFCQPNTCFVNKQVNQ